jgi:5-aminopentanamidase
VPAQVGVKECRLGDALSKAIGPANDVHADRRPELYRRITEEAIPQQTAWPG